jgi:Fe-S-cluster containining protein
MAGMAKIRALDRQLVQIIDTALAETTRKSGDWLVCKPGCTQCCIGAFAISQLDAARLRQGLVELERQDPARAARVRGRAIDSIERLAADFPGDPITGILDESPQAEERFAEFANDEPCPALDPEKGTCDLYAARPMTCRVFGPPVRSEGGLGVCELCYHGATEEQIAACEMAVDPDNLESALLQELESSAGLKGQTMVAFSLNR